MVKKKSSPQVKEPIIRLRKITDYLPDPTNANKGTERGLQMVENSLSEDGVGRSIVADGMDRIPAGNKTLEAAMNAGIEQVIEIETDGHALIVHKRTDWDLSDPQGAARRYAYRDNRASEISLNWDEEQIMADLNAGVDLSKLFSETELQIVLGQYENIAIPSDDTQENDAAPSQGELLKLVNITIAEPHHQPATGDVYRLSGRHILICAQVITDWMLWKSYLVDEQCLFCPYPGVFMPLSLKADNFNLVMVQPDLYIAGHILDRYEDIHGETAIQKITH